MRHRYLHRVIAGGNCRGGESVALGSEHHGELVDAAKRRIRERDRVVFERECRRLESERIIRELYLAEAHLLREDYQLPVGERIARVEAMKARGYTSDFQKRLAEHYLTYKSREDALYRELMQLTDALYE
jgi:hypothetical protein